MDWGNRVLHLYGNAMVGKVFKKISEIDNQGQGHCRHTVLHELTYGVPVRCGSFTVTALKANHKPDEDAMIYLLEKEGKHVLYAHDTGELDPSVYAYLISEAAAHYVGFCESGLYLRQIKLSGRAYGI